MKSAKINITKQGESELSLNFLGNKKLYNQLLSATDFNQVSKIANEIFDFTEAQIDDLETTYNNL